jgi:hypothetical protein
VPRCADHGRIGFSAGIVDRCDSEEVGAVVTVRLVGGPLDGEQWDETEEEVARGGGAYLLVAGPQAAGMRAHYAPEPGSDPAVWTRRGWVPD